MLKMSISNPQVAIAGKVVEGETERVIAGAVVEIIEMPKRFQAILALKALPYGSRWEKMRDTPGRSGYRDRPDCKITDNNGYFYFVDLPPGEYLLEASLPGSGTRYSKVQKKVKISHSVNGKNSTMMANMVLSPTGIKGTISEVNDPKKVILNAKIQVQGSPESAISNQKGNYHLLGLESAKSGQSTVTLIVFATGYQQVSQSVVIQQGAIISNQNFSLNPQ
jgi:hypothetical protein